MLFLDTLTLPVDEEIILESVKTKYDLVKGIQRTIQAEINPMITQCTINELYKTNNYEAINLAKTFERRRCNHFSRPKKETETEQEKQDDENEKSSKNKKKPQEGPKSAFDCITSVVNVNGKNLHRYCVATQKKGLRSYLRAIPAVPLIYMKRSVMIMEPMSPVTLKARETIEKSKLTQGLNDPTNLKRKTAEEAEDDENDTDNEDSTQPTKKRKGPKQPNPLSIKKKKTPTTTTTSDPTIITSETESKKKRRRKHHHSNTNPTPPSSP